MSQWLSLLKDFFQIAFFIVVGVITILAFLKAKKTLLQPIRTEIFKSQLDEFSHILKMFMGKGELELREDFAFEKLTAANCYYLFDSYAALFFDLKVKLEERPYNHKDCPQSRFSREAAEKYLEVVDDYKIDDEKEKKEERPDPRTKAAIWSKFQYNVIHMPREFSEMQDRFRRIMESPLIPQECLSLLEEYLGTVHQNVETLAELLTGKAKELPEKYQNIDSLRKASYSWIHHEYMGKFQKLKEKADKIIKYLRTYFDVDVILK